MREVWQRGSCTTVFSSTTGLLDAIIERTIAQTLISLQPLIDDPSCDAPTRLDQFFQRTQRWKRVLPCAGFV